VQNRGKTIHGSLSEQKVSKRLDGKLNPGSGAVGGIKGDIKFEKILMESKATIKDSISIKLEWLAKISREATDASKTPALSVTYVNDEGDPRKFGKWVMIPETLFKEINEICKKEGREEE
jgi:hypothetical protein